MTHQKKCCRTSDYTIVGTAATFTQHYDSLSAVAVGILAAVLALILLSVFRAVLGIVFLVRILVLVVIVFRHF